VWRGDDASGPWRPAADRGDQRQTLETSGRPWRPAADRGDQRRTMETSDGTWRPATGPGGQQRRVDMVPADPGERWMVCGPMEIGVNWVSEGGSLFGAIGEPPYGGPPDGSFGPPRRNAGHVKRSAVAIGEP
jgi:hypothetical protein